MEVKTFAMERWQSEWEHVVANNLSESGVRPLCINDFVPEDEIANLIQTKLGYIQTDGTQELKKLICAMYTGASADNVLVTTGSAEANFLLMWRLVNPGDEMVFVLPNFLQMQGLMEAYGANLKPLFLKEELDWSLSVDDIKQAVTKNTKLISLTNPNNPTGGILDAETRNALIDMAKWAGAWLIVDEVYQGSELNGEITPSFWGTYEKVVITSGFSKAYGLPGLRTGWLVAPSELTKAIWTYKDYTSITISALSDRLARIALRSDNRRKIFERTRSIIKVNLEIFDAWSNDLGGFFSYVPPQAGAIVFPRYSLDINSTQLAHRIRELKNVLICPGDQFGLDFHIRFGLGETSSHFSQGLSLVQEGLQIIQDSA